MRRSNQRLARLGAAAIATVAITAVGAIASPEIAAAGPKVTTRQAYAFFDGQACVAGHCAPIGQARLWYDSWDTAGRDFRRVQLNWFSYRKPCNTWIDFDATSTDGQRKLWHAQGSTHAGCRFKNSSATRTQNPGTFVIPDHTATVCGTVFRAGKPDPELVTKVCVYVG